MSRCGPCRKGENRICRSVLVGENTRGQEAAELQTEKVTASPRKSKSFLLKSKGRNGCGVASQGEKKGTGKKEALPKKGRVVI